MPSFEDTLAEVENELGISGAEEVAGVGYLEDASIGAVPVPGKVYGRPRIHVPAPGDAGDGVVWPVPATAAVALAAAAVGNLTFTPNRNISIRDIELDCYVAAAAAAAIMPAALKVTSITVQGRPQLAGTGELPLSAFRPLNPMRVKPVMENCQSGQNVVIALRNDDAATTHNVTGILWCTCVK